MVVAQQVKYCVQSEGVQLLDERTLLLATCGLGRDQYVAQIDFLSRPMILPSGKGQDVCRPILTSKPAIVPLDR